MLQHIRESAHLRLPCWTLVPHLSLLMYPAVSLVSSCVLRSRGNVSRRMQCTPRSSVMDVAKRWSLVSSTHHDIDRCEGTSREEAEALSRGRSTPTYMCPSINVSDARTACINTRTNTHVRHRRVNLPATSWIRPHTPMACA